MVHVEENLRINLHELRLGNDFLDTNQSTSDKRKTRSTWLHQDVNLLCYRGHQQGSKKTTHRTGENTCKFYTQRGLVPRINHLDATSLKHVSSELSKSMVSLHNIPSMPFKVLQGSFLKDICYSSRTLFQVAATDSASVEGVAPPRPCQGTGSYFKYTLTKIRVYMCLLNVGTGLIHRIKVSAKEIF